MEITFDHFTSEEQAREELEAAGLYVVPFEAPAGENPTHWHEFESSTYILEGMLELTETDSGKTCHCTKGTRISSAAGVLHSEKTEGFKGLVGISVDPATITQPIDKPPSELK